MRPRIARAMKRDDAFPRRISHEAAVKKLLKLAGVPDTSAMRQALNEAFDVADHYFVEAIERTRPLPRKTLKKVVAAVDRLVAAIKEASKGPSYYDHWLFDDRPYFEEPPDAMTKSRIGSVLRHIRGSAERYATMQRKRGQPRRDDKQEVVGCALYFLEKHASPRLGGRDRDRFVELFYHMVTGRDVERGELAWQIQEEGSKLRAARKASAAAR
jgi:hypothetical protein